MESAGYCQMATCVDGQPRVRPMKFVITDDFKFWCTTINISGKVKELEANAKIELCWVDKEGNHLRVSGTADMSGGVEKKKNFLNCTLEPGDYSVTKMILSWCMLKLFPPVYDGRHIHSANITRWIRNSGCPELSGQLFK